METSDPQPNAGQANEPVIDTLENEKTAEVQTSGVLRIKERFILTAVKRVIQPQFLAEEDKDKLTTEDEYLPPDKKVKLSKSEKKKLSGRNKKRPRIIKVPRSEKLCPFLKDITAGEDAAKKCQYPGCSFLHDVDAYLQRKPANIGGTCYNFETFGKCSSGLTCRFGSSHISEKNYNVVNPEMWEKHSEVQHYSNSLAKEVQHSLWKHKYNFEKSEEALRQVTQAKIEANEVKSGAIGPVIDSMDREKRVDWKGKLYLAPLTTVGNLPFRRICKKFGADITCGEMAVAANILQGKKEEWALLRRHESEDIFGVQASSSLPGTSRFLLVLLCGNNAKVMTRCAQVIQEQTEVDFVDINMGCPIDLIYRQGGGSALLRRHSMLETMCKSMKQVLEVPLTLKMRTAIYQGKNVAHNLIPKAVTWGVDAITLHGRSKEQRYTKLADWAYIEECAKLAAPIPLIGNGDILSSEDAWSHLENSSVAGLMIARGALIKPWIFTEIKERRDWDISSHERLDILQEYVNFGLEHWGSDTEGVEKTRRFLLEWLSFLHRYVPVGILERPPQHINARPPPYQGRDELETLFSSPSCAAWIKITEMLLGPVQSDFQFLPKHKANAWG
ncbi:unnamed protein product [Darwinula stevensoni]|uniref:tRNA-dihydrouridine(47) synthase [NAD(P)(+)] n=1 Tax=Darwinula stevensoni TaxID=69355 RepID=A0A7R8X463_9CRUS|nr:unnamed protein product [Darwinula stevensoni]CAG0883290.1 unnamed protein product [Darwinula stevensoni]